MNTRCLLKSEDERVFSGEPRTLRPRRERPPHRRRIVASALLAIVFILPIIAVVTGNAANAQLATSDTASRADTGHGAFLGAKSTEYPDWFKQSFLELR